MACRVLHQLSFSGLGIQDENDDAIPAPCLQNLLMEERYALCEKLKAKANQLFKRQRYAHARGRYTRLLRLLDSTRDFETDEEMAKITAYQVRW